MTTEHRPNDWLQIHLSANPSVHSCSRQREDLEGEGVRVQPSAKYLQIDWLTSVNIPFRTKPSEGEKALSDESTNQTLD